MKSDFRACSVLFRGIYANGEISVRDLAQECGVDTDTAARWIASKLVMHELQLVTENGELFLDPALDKLQDAVLLSSTPVSTNEGVSTHNCEHSNISKEILILIVKGIKREGMQGEREKRVKKCIDPGSSSEPCRPRKSKAKRPTKTEIARSQHFDIGRTGAIEILDRLGPYAHSLWMKWVETRADRKQWLTELAVKIQLERLAEFPPDEATRLLEDAAASGYRGIVFPNQLKAKKAKSNASSWNTKVL